MIQPKNDRRQLAWVASGMIGTGPYKFANYVEDGAEVRAQHRLLGRPPPLDGVNITFYQGTAPQVLALKAGTLDLAMQLSAQEAASFEKNSKYQTVGGRPRSIARSGCAPTRRRSRTPCSAGGRAHARPAPADQDPVRRASGRQRQPDLDGLPSPIRRSSSACRTSARQGAARRRGCSRTCSSRSRRGRRRRSRTSRRHPVGRKEAGIEHRLEFLDVGEYYGSAPGRTTRRRRRG